MKICFVNLASGYSGGENQTFLLARELKRVNIDLVAVTHPRSPLTSKLEQIGVEVVKTTNFFQGHNAPLLKDVSLLHVHDGRGVHWASVHNMLRGTPFIITRRIDNNISERFLTKLSYERASLFVGISRKICSVLKEYLPEKDVELIPSSPVSYEVEEQAVNEIRAQYQGKFLVIQAATLLEHKGFDISISAARELENEDVQFLFLGDGPYKTQLTALAKGCSNVQFLGKRSDMGNWFNAADCLVLPSRNEGLGSVLLEAMQAGTPVIGANVGGIPDVIKDRTTGLLIPPNSPRALADAILLEKNDEGLKKQMVENARLFVRSIAIEQTAPKYLAIYERVLGYN